MLEKIKVMEWNVHGAGGYENYSIPVFIADKIDAEDADIVILVEFYIGCNWEYIRSKLEKKYDVVVSPFSTGYNQILIALKKSIFRMENIVTINPIDINKPELLQLDTTVIGNNKKITIVGVRIKKQKNREKEQFEFLQNYFDKLDNFICLGDFNRVLTSTNKILKNKYLVYSPRVNDYFTKYERVPSRWSYVHKNKSKSNIDLIISKNVIVLKSISDELSKEKGYTMYANYDWSFISENNGYGNFTSEDYLSQLIGLPDHAILLGEFKIK